ATIEYVPTAAMMAGDWTTFASPTCNGGRQINLGSPFINNRIDPGRYSQPALNIAAKLPPPQAECGKITYSVPQKPDEYQIVGKVDYQHSAKHSLFGRYVLTSYVAPHPYVLSNHSLLTLSALDGGFDNLAQSYALGSTYLIGPNTINALRLSVHRM